MNYKEFFRLKKEGDIHEQDTTFTIVDLLREILSVIAVMVIAFLWVITVLLILSFIAITYIPFHIKWMMPVAIISGIIAGIVQIVKIVKKYRQKR